LDAAAVSGPEDDAARGLRPDGAAWLNFYGRRRGKPLRARQRDLLEHRLAELAPPGASPTDNPERRPVDLSALFPGRRAVWLEIGFGAGEHLLATAAANRDVGIIGCEPFVNGVASFLSALEDAGLDNVRVHADDARFLFDVLPQGGLGRVYLLYPDPWPKRRHADRRFVNHRNLDPLAPLMAPGAELRIATDVPEYVEHARAILAERADFRLIDIDPRTPWQGWPGTRYEAKALREGRTPTYLRYERV
jgi:tRNA (guanine-N7-)-methyltransferase